MANLLIYWEKKLKSISRKDETNSKTRHQEEFFRKNRFIKTFTKKLNAGPKTYIGTCISGTTRSAQQHTYKNSAARSKKFKSLIKHVQQPNHLNKSHFTKTTNNKTISR
jgi:hypothetical protein